MWGRFVDSILALPWYWRVFLLACLPLIIGVLVVMSLPASPTLRAIQSVGGEVFEPFATTPFEKLNSTLGAVFRRPYPKDLYLGPRDQSRMISQQVYNDRLTDEAILQIDLSEIGPLRIVDISGPHVTDRGFAHVAGNTLVHNLVCRNAQVTDAGLAALEKNTSLYAIDLTGNKITDAGIGLIARSPALDSIQLDDTYVTDKAIQELASSNHRVVGLRIASTDVTTTGLAGLSQIRGLQSVGLDVFQFSDEAVTILQPLSLNHFTICTCSDRKKQQLSQLRATYPSQIDDQVISKVAKLTTLEMVFLCGATPGEPAALSPAAVSSLASMPNLKYLYVVDLTIDHDILSQLQRTNPLLRIWAEGKPFKPW